MIYDRANFSWLMLQAQQDGLYDAWKRIDDLLYDQSEEKVRALKNSLLSESELQGEIEKIDRDYDENLGTLQQIFLEALKQDLGSEEVERCIDVM